MLEQTEPRLRRRLSRPLVAAVVLSAAALLLIVLLSVNTGSSASATNGQSLLILLPAAFLAGVLSFLSPCTLPILPAYFAFTFQAQKQNVVLMTVAFFLGLATTVTLLGATATAISALLFQHIQSLTLLGGWVIILFGVMNLLGLGFAGPQFQGKPAATVAGTNLYGATFALGWTACVGPILGAILTLLATQGVAVLQGGLLAFVYALGLGAPLILVSAFFSRLGQGSRFWQLLKGRGFDVKVGGATLYLHTSGILSGLLLIVVGYLLASGQLTAITRLAAGSDLSTWVVQLEDRLMHLMGLR
ncbi:MAG: cytochrome c biogenesis protein CcdA [Anaerolineales bacterium]|nr:cytochrome c biogenesis protein CcdA [Anaerolineales bacterium]